jgi:hypothetical protein
VEERPFRAASERLSERGFSPGDKKSLGFLRGPSHLSFVILSDARRSVAPERESKDLCTLSLERWHQGILTVPSMIEVLAVCKRRGTCCRLPYLFVILSAAKHSRLALFRCHPERTRVRAAV